MKINPSLQKPDAFTDSMRLAFDDPDFMVRDEARGIRLQLELLKADVLQAAAGIEHTVVVFGSARFVSLEQAQERLAQALLVQDEPARVLAERAVRQAAYYEAAREFAHLVAKASADNSATHRFTICTGGGPGIMEAANRGAYEAGAQSVALNIALPHEQIPNAYISPHLSFKFHYFAIRKMHFMLRAKALVAFPGGFGTMDELFEILTLIQTRKSQQVPVLLYGSSYWKKVIDFEAMLDHGTITQADQQCFRYVDSPSEAWQAIQAFYQR
jgi:hypothetical protein